MPALDVTSVILYILATYSALLIVFGTLTSIINIIVCLRKRLRRVNTFVVLIFISFSDIFTLYCWNVDRFLNWYFPSLPYENISLTFCKIIVYIQFVSLEWSSWLLVLLNIDRYLSITTKTWRTVHFKPFRAAIYCVLIGLIFALINIYMLVTNGYDTQIVTYTNVTDPVTNMVYLTNTTTTKTTCYQNPNYLVYPFWKIINAFIYSVVPFCILVATNTFFIYSTAKNTRRVNEFVSNTARNERTEKQNAMNIMIILTTALFIFTTLPYSIVSCFFFTSIQPSNLLIYPLSDLSFTYHSLNFIVFYVCNKIFRSEVKHLVRMIFTLGMSRGRVDSVMTGQTVQGNTIISQSNHKSNLKQNTIKSSH